MITVPVVRAITRNAVRSILHGLEGDNSPVFPAALTGITHIIFMGASLEVGMIESSNGVEDTVSQNYCASQGVNVKVMRYAATGATVDTVYANWTNTYKAAIQAIVDGGGKVAVSLQPLGNTITDLKPYASASTATLTAKYNIYKNLIAEIKAVVGARNVFLVRHTFRNYDPTGSCVTDQSLGSLPFNTNWVLPEATLTDWMYSGAPYIDLYPIDFNNYTLTFAVDDQIHSKPVHYPAKSKYVMDGIIAAIKGTAPPRVPMKADPITDQKPKNNRAILQYRSTSTLSRSPNFLCANYRGSTLITAQDSIGPMDTYEPVFGLGARTRTWAATANTSFGTGDTSRTILNDNLRLYYQGANSATYEVFETITNCDPTKPLNIRILGCRSTTAGLTRFMDVSGDGTTTLGTVDTACQAAVVPNVLQLSIMPDASGNVPIWTRNSSGNTSGYGIAAIEIWQ